MLMRMVGLTGEMKIDIFVHSSLYVVRTGGVKYDFHVAIGRLNEDIIYSKVVGDFYIFYQMTPPA